MIRIALECALVFFAPAALYFGYQYFMGNRASEAGVPPKTPAEIVEAAPLLSLFGVGAALLFGTLLTFATLQEPGVDKPYAPAVYKDGKIVDGRKK